MLKLKFIGKFIEFNYKLEVPQQYRTFHTKVLNIADQPHSTLKFQNLKSIKYYYKSKREMMQHDNSKDRISIIGAGLVGCTMAALLVKKGFNNIDVFEKRPNEAVGGQRSINLALSARGIKTLTEAGVMDRVEEIAIPMKGRMIHTAEGTKNFQPYSSDSNKHLFSVSRHLLNEYLRNYASSVGKDGVRFHFNQTIRDIELNKGSFVATDNSTGTSTSFTSATIIGADGAFSAVRSAMTRRDRQDYSQSFLEHGYKELHIPPGPNGSFQLDKNSLHIWPRRSYMMIALPNVDGSFTCTLFFAFDGTENSFAALDSPAKVDQFFRTVFPDAHALMPTLLQDFANNPTSSLVTAKTFPWCVGGRAVLAGDAAHAIVPFYGQGLNAGFEDCLDLYHCIQDEMSAAKVASPSEALVHDNLLARAYHSYQTHRKENSDAIAEMAVENFYEMRNHVADPLFVFKKKVEHLLEEKFPGRYLSRYELISFSCVPYADAQRIGVINQQILSILTKDANLDITKIDLQLADSLITQHLSSFTSILKK